MHGEGHVLIGAKHGYVNGFFHNWDFPLSALSSINKISEPFLGIELVYFYTVHHSVQSQETRIPVPYDVDPDEIIKQIQDKNNDL